MITRENAIKCVGPGWRKLVEIAIDCKPEGTEFTTIKEKWGSAHIYVSSAPMSYYKILDLLEQLSIRICEDCGSAGEQRQNLGWWRTLCDDCMEGAIHELE